MTSVSPPARSADVDHIDHAVLLTTRLDALSGLFEALGFTLSPRSPHLLSERPGGPLLTTCTANRCALFGETYIELLGIVDPEAADPWRVRLLAAEYEGLRILSFGCGDIGTVADRLTAAGLSSTGVRDLRRDVETPEGTRTVEARVVHIDRDRTPEGAAHVAQHLTPQYVHQPRYLTHPNGARRLDSVLLVVADEELEAYASRYSRLLGTAPVRRGEARAFPLRAGRVDLVPVSALGTVLPGRTAPVLPFLAAVGVAVADVAAARALAERNGVPVRPTDSGFLVRSEDAYGVNIVFVEG
ncbi:VOC family protein [Streptomyces sp. I05A-00742]|uniref:VOC family protein n=1 Tax=Streptomyces sp. I05A-00742 TaxID=2732853 RepID=UPI0014877D62|nr:VOC family protein [Streptomyces sp. I05A-00742]